MDHFILFEQSFLDGLLDSPEMRSMHQELTTHTQITQDATLLLKKPQNTNITDHQLSGLKLATERVCSLPVFKIKAPILSLWFS